MSRIADALRRQYVERLEPFEIPEIMDDGEPLVLYLGPPSPAEALEAPAILDRIENNDPAAVVDLMVLRLRGDDGGPAFDAADADAMRSYLSAEDLIAIMRRLAQQYENDAYRRDDDLGNESGATES